MAHIGLHDESLATIGESDRAVHQLARAAAAGMPNYPAFSLDPHFQSIQNEPGFKKLMAGMKVGWQSFKNEFGGSDSVTF